MQWYKFFYQIHHGFELAQALPEDKLNTRVELTISKMKKDKTEKKMEHITMPTQFFPGRYPTWNLFERRDVQLPDLTFAPDLRVTLQNQKKGAFGATSNLMIGEFAIPMVSLLKRNSKPQFFNFISPEGRFVGQVLCNFWLKESEPPNKRKKSEYLKNLWIDTAEEFKEGLKPLCNVKINVSVLGIRNLLNKANQPCLKVKMTDGKHEESIEIDDKLKDFMGDQLEDRTWNPTFSKLVEFENVELVWEPLFWPYITVQLVDKAREDALIKAFVPGCEQCFTTISLLDYANDEIIPELDLLYARMQLSRNQD